MPVPELSDSENLKCQNIIHRQLPCHTSTSECAVTSHRQRRMLVLLQPEGLPLQKTGASATHRSPIFSATMRTYIQPRLHLLQTKETAHLDATRQVDGRKHQDCIPTRIRIHLPPSWLDLQTNSTAHILLEVKRRVVPTRCVRQ